MRNKLLIRASVKIFSGLIIISGLLFLLAGSVNYWNAWLFLSLLFVPMLTIGIILLIKSPELLAKRLNSKETQAEQKQVIILSSLMFVGSFAATALDYRFGWSKLPVWAVITASVVFLTSYVLYAEVMRENAYLSRTVEVQHDQKVVDTGLYGVVRHPMYFATVLLFLSMPIILGSLVAFAIFLVYPFVLVKRIKSEEAILREGLPGYCEYIKKVKYRLIPFVW